MTKKKGRINISKAVPPSIKFTSKDVPDWAFKDSFNGGPVYEVTDIRVSTHQQMDFEDLVGSILSTIGEDPDREGLRETPRRVAEAWLNELVVGYTMDPTDVFKTFDHTDKGEMVVIRDVPVYSLCEHHMLPFYGVAHFAYIPDARILGLSKFARLVDVFARRLQVQERLTSEIIDAFEDGMKPKASMIILEAEHLCMKLRGVQVTGSKTVTSAIRGLFRDVPAARDEAMRLIYGR